jgi:hypothetical protein
VTIQSSYLQVANVIDGFSIDFQNKNNPSDKITLSIVPNNFIYVTNEEIEPILTKASNAMSHLIANKNSIEVGEDLLDAIKNAACDRMDSDPRFKDATMTGAGTTITVTSHWEDITKSDGTDGEMTIITTGTASGTNLLFTHTC